MISWQDWIVHANKRLCKIKNKNTKNDAMFLLKKITGIEYSTLLASKETLLTKIQQNQLELLLKRCEKGEPIAYLFQECEFWSLCLRVTTDTFIPRIDTECLVQKSLDLLPDYHANVLDLGTGSGAIALALASERSQWQITGIDYYEKTLAIARENAKKLNLKNVKFIKGNWFQPVQKKKYDLIVSNPPYIKENDKHLKSNNIKFEPFRALISGKRGLTDLTIICNQANKYLISGGWLILEHGWKQGKEVRKLLNKAGFSHIYTMHDYNKKERIGYGKYDKQL